HSHDVTSLLQAWTEGDERALGRLMPVVYDELHRVARRQMAGERPTHTLQATALVHEVYVRLVDVRQASFSNRGQFFGMCAHLMRNVLAAITVSEAPVHHADMTGQTGAAIPRDGLCANDSAAVG